MDEARDRVGNLIAGASGNSIALEQLAYSLADSNASLRAALAKARQEEREAAELELIQLICVDCSRGNFPTRTDKPLARWKHIYTEVSHLACYSGRIYERRYQRARAAEEGEDA